MFLICPMAIRDKVLTLVLFSILLALFSSCKAYKKVPYLKDLENDTILSTIDKMEPTLAYKDQFTIVVNTPTPEASEAFNLTTTPRMMTGKALTGNAQMMQAYEVNQDGDITFPVLGKIHVAGMTREELQDTLKNMLYPKYITEEPIIVIQRTNFAVSVLGEVKSPGRFMVTNDRVSVLEALAMAGDMTLYGKRDNVLVVREDDMGNKTTARLNLQDKDVFQSPFFYLKQNDLVYVTPNKSRGNTSAITSSVTIVFSVVSMLVTLTNLTINLSK